MDLTVLRSSVAAVTAHQDDASEVPFIQDWQFMGLHHIGDSVAKARTKTNPFIYRHTFGRDFQV
jgi:hypothetical protein